LWFEEDHKAFRQRRGGFSFFFGMAFTALVLLALMFFTIDLILGGISGGNIYLWVMLAAVLITSLFVYLVQTFKGRPMEFYENGIVLTRFGIKYFKPYTAFSHITEERNPEWGKMFLLHTKSPLNLNIHVPRSGPRVEKYISRIRDKIEEGEREEAQPFVRG
jgi:hypothetical protein